MSPFASRRSRKRRSDRPRDRRRLRAETLELRLCLSAVRIVTWNTENGPDHASDDADFGTVFQAIGNETVQGNTLPPSIVALQETDNAQFGGNSIARVESILESLYPQTNYDHAVSTLDTGDDANGFVYDTEIFDLVSTSVVAPTTGMTPFAHRIFRGQFRPDGTTGQSDFYIYSTHLKAGSDNTNRNRRTAEANAIRLDIDALGANQDVLVMGDFNIAGSSEGAYQNFLSSGNGQLFDPIDRPGQWKNNSSFKSIHTQNPEINGAGGMDDRYDFHLASSAVFDEAGLQYIDGSYRAFGNNGTHTFNSDITTGTGASVAVLAALAAASDHLPVVVDYEIDVDLVGISLSESGNSTTTVEGGAGDSYTVVLNSIPTSDVTVTVSADGQTRVDGAASTTLVFTPASALIPQTVAVTAIDDVIAEGLHSSELTHTVSSVDVAYNALPPKVLTTTVIDSDTPSVVISEIMYNPSSPEPNGEWVEIVNLGPGSVDVSGWILDDEDSVDWSAIPQGTPPLAQGEIAIIHNSVVPSSMFRSVWSVPASTQLIGVTWGSLSNSPNQASEILELRDSGGVVQDVVNFDDDGVDWPADNGRSSLYLADLLVDNNVGSNWSLSVAGRDGATNPTGAPLSTADVGSPGIAPVNRPPTDLQLVPDTLNENIDTSGTVSMVSGLVVVDPDFGDTHTFELVAGAGDADNAAFLIFGSTLFLRQNEIVDFEQQPSYQIRVATIDAAGARLETAIGVEVVNLPELVEVRYDENSGAEAQRSKLQSLTVVFDQLVSVDAGAFELVKRGEVSPVEAAVGVSVSLSESAGRSEARLSFSGNHVESLSGSLADGNYVLKVLGSGVTGVSGGLLLDGDRDGVPGGDEVIGDTAVDQLFRLFGDSDGDRDVDGQDYGRFGLTFSRSAGQPGFDSTFDSDGDDDVDGQDYGRFGQRFLRSMPF